MNPPTKPVLSPMPVKRESVKPGRLYIWHVQNDRMRVCKLNADESGLVTMDDGDEWFFESELIGELFGPVLLPSNEGWAFETC
jgi:hypothetical protein